MYRALKHILNKNIYIFFIFSFCGYSQVFTPYSNSFTSPSVSINSSLGFPFYSISDDNAPTLLSAVIQANNLADHDSDGINTVDEDLNGNSDPNDDDTDGDGIPNYLESNLVDTDKDGVADELDSENENPNNDQDGDGFPNIDEVKYGSDPSDPNDTPSIKDLLDSNISYENFFSPNGDGIDDLWRIREVERYAKCGVEIYSRSGQLIYSARPYQNDWNGEFEGKPVPQGSYLYLLDIDGDGNFDLNGWLYLAR